MGSGSFVRWRRLAAGIALAGSTALASPAVAIETLREALASAYISNPTLDAQRANLRALDEGVPQALSGWRPTVTANANYGLGWQESQFSEERTHPLSADLTVTQPIYRGGRTVNATRQAEESVLAGRASLDQVEQTVLLAAVTAYLDVMRDQEVVAISRNNVEVITKQLEASNDRFEVGEITRTDVAQAEARLARASSTLTQAEGVLSDSIAAFRRVVGEAPGALQDPPPLPPLPETEEEAREIALQESPTIIAARHNERASDYATRATRGQLLPSVDVVGRLAYSEQGSLRTSRSTSATVVGQITVPLYQSGRVYSQIRQAMETNSEQRLRIAEAERQVIEAVNNAWEALRTARATIQSDQEQVKANEIAFEGVSQEALVGSRTTLDVLDAEQELLDARVALVRSERNEYVAGYQLLSAMGRLTAAQLGSEVAIDVEPYDPTVHYDAVRNRAFGYDGDVEGSLFFPKPRAKPE